MQWIDDTFKVVGNRPGFKPKGRGFSYKITTKENNEAKKDGQVLEEFKDYLVSICGEGVNTIVLVSHNVKGSDFGILYDFLEVGEEKSIKIGEKTIEFEEYDP
eukprot:TRINITY_DN1982_c0_g1_i5.p2 TRINITY_DN1982_c0_g1~~TRINITY_DN1982_c0_g1_i5.p2  ORF type:complete len:103 (-),score=26.03 TRINITY_DN1982_c0_g1_i5:53-361(-)